MSFPEERTSQLVWLYDMHLLLVCRSHCIGSRFEATSVSRQTPIHLISIDQQLKPRPSPPVIIVFQAVARKSLQVLLPVLIPVLNSTSNHNHTNIYSCSSSLDNSTSLPPTPTQIMSEELDLSLVKKWTLEEMVEPESAEGSPKKSKKLKAIQWGFPGHLTQQELGVYVKFQKEVETRGGEFKNTVFSFSELEGEAHTLTRWLRARKYNLADTIAMVSEATEVRAEPRGVDYYPNAHDVLGVDPSIFVSQYPQLYAGVSKTGVPVFYSKTGVLNINGIECITTLEGILKFHWHVMQHDFKKRLLERKKADPSFVRFECVTVMDLKGLSMSSLNKRTLEIIKKQATIDSLCFPETMNKMVIVNAPKFFSATWSIIKGFLDARTAAKVELFSSSSAAEKCLRELIDLDQLPKDYGGKAESTDSLLEKEASKDATDGGRTRLATNVFYVRSSDSFKFTLAPDEAADLVVYTKSNTGASFKVTDSSTKKAVIPAKTVIHKASNSDNVPPTVVHLNEERISGVSEVKVKAEGLRSQMSYECYLLAVNIFKK